MTPRAPRRLPPSGRAIPAVVVALALALAACTDGLTEQAGPPARTGDPSVSSPPPARAAPVSPELDWRRCHRRLECATLTVPLDHARPAGAKVELAVIRRAATEPARRLGSLVVNPGGPGGSGVAFVRRASTDAVPAELRARFDIVGFDPRGVGRSQPVSCGGASGRLLSQDLDPRSRAEVEPLLAAAHALADACRDRNGALLARMSTADVARDLDVLRAAVGDERLTYLGYSYGTFLGATYASLFPDRVRALVLDGAVDPALGAAARARQQAVQLEQTLEAFFVACDAARACRVGTGPGQTRARFDALLARLESSPLPVDGSGRSLGASEMLVATAGLLKDRGPGWTGLGIGLALAAQGDGSLLLAVADGALGHSARRDWLAPLLAVNCLDVPAPAAPAYPALAARLAAAAPHFGALTLYLSSPCAYWPVAPQRAAEPLDVTGVPPLLVIGTTGDPTTPYAWSRSLAESIEGAVLVTRDARSHTAFGASNACTDRTVIRYLVDLTVPPAGTRCR